MPNWLRIRNEAALLNTEFGVSYNAPSGIRSIPLASIDLQRSESFRCSDVGIPEGVSCWVYQNTDAGHYESGSNFNCNYSDSQTAAYNFGQSGFSLEIQPN